MMLNAKERSANRRQSGPPNLASNSHSQESVTVRRTLLASTLVLALLAAGSRAQAVEIAFDPVSFLISYSLGKLLDEFVVDPIILGKPDVRKLDKRLRELEEN